MMMKVRLMKRLSWLFALVLCIPVAHALASPPPPVDWKKQGFSMKMWMDNKGVFGVQAFQEGNGPNDSLGLEYPSGTDIEHVFGGGIWVGGLLDTSVSGSSAPLNLVTTGYEGWILQELTSAFRMTNRRDTVWTASRADSIAPPGWDAYWGGVFRIQSDLRQRLLHEVQRFSGGGGRPCSHESEVLSEFVFLERPIRRRDHCDRVPDRE